MNKERPGLHSLKRIDQSVKTRMPVIFIHRINGYISCSFRQNLIDL